MAGFEGINARVGGNIINPLPYLQEYTKTNPWYNPMMKGPDIVGGISSVVNQMRYDEERERKAGLEERDVGAREKQAEASMKRASAMEVSALASGKPTKKTLSAKDQMMHDSIMGSDLPDEVKTYFQMHGELPPESNYPEEMLDEALTFISQKTGQTVTRDQVKSRKAQDNLIGMYLKEKVEADAGDTTEALSPESVEVNYTKAAGRVKNSYVSPMAKLILEGHFDQKELPERLRAFEAVNHVRLDMPFEFNVIRKLVEQNPDLVRPEQKAYYIQADNTSRLFEKEYNKYGDEYFKFFEDPAYREILQQSDDVDPDVMYWMYYVHSGKLSNSRKGSGGAQKWLEDALSKSYLWVKGIVTNE